MPQTDQQCVIARCGRPVNGVFVCRTHVAELVGALRELAVCRTRGPHGERVRGLLADLDDVITRQARLGPTTGTRAPGAGPSLPVNLQAAEVGARVGATITTWARDLAETHPHLALTATSVAQAAAWLARYPHLLATHPAADELFADITAVYAEVVRVVDLPVDRRAYLGRCGDLLGRTGCRGTVFAAAGSHRGHCDRCGAEHDADERRSALLRAMANRHLTAPEIATLLRRMQLDITVGDIQRCGRTGQIHPVSIDPHGRRHYAVHDVLAAFPGLAAATRAVSTG